jgi:uncharacterized protein (TIGR00725 family)
MELISHKNEATQHVPLVGVIGASSAEASVLAVAVAVGKAIGRRGWHLITGGGGGVMQAACEGHRLGRTETDPPGVTIGVLPCNEPDDANPFVDIPLSTGVGLARNAIIARAAAGLVAIGGCSGTLSEIALAWQFGRPIAAMVEAGGWAATLAGACLDDRFDRPVFAARDAGDALDFLAKNMK